MNVVDVQTQTPMMMMMKMMMLIQVACWQLNSKPTTAYRLLEQQQRLCKLVIGGDFPTIAVAAAVAGCNCLT